MQMPFPPLNSQGRQEAARAHYDKGAHLYHGNRVDEAIVEFTEALRQDGNFSRARFGLAACMERKSRFDDAIREYQEGLKTDGNNASAHFDFGNLLYRTGRVTRRSASI